MSRPALPSVVVDDTLGWLRLEVREFIAAQAREGLLVGQVDSWLTGWDEDFSRSLAERGWLGMTIPIEYGGRGRGFLERFVVTEELLAAGAPLAAHWISDRQIAPSLLKYGTEFQKETLLPGIAAGQTYFAIGMSEPDSGSDLASVRTRATRVDGGWRVDGSKVWTSGAHRSHYFIVLARTAAVDPDNRHSGLSQFIVDLRGPGVDVRPILSLDGRHHFNEVFLDDVYVPDEWVFGTIGAGWEQVTSELGYERSGPERFLSTFPLLDAMTGACADGELENTGELGRALARTAALHEFSAAIANGLSRGEPVDVAASMTKVLGTALEGDIAELAGCYGMDARSSTLGEDLRALSAAALAQRPGFTLRGGTNEVLRGVIARGWGLR
ncbi:acyl-CoA dehydrogenase family protein [Gordonia alkanivorans]|uniref:acyl-CoA dehydrogenase family protein n=1 Tax=Gordonia alkanivorans TaxID=84096 RepID=UPI00244B08C6|nr:acyl-CoA dehydrogenase family protein [Gordonia alkanivorans]MDH3047229.1 acyl-CoA dehydrogenase family protein [Gordonia alkanivorans]